MNILILTNPSYGCYGYSMVARHVCKGLRDAGHNVWVIGTVTAGNLIKDEYGTPNIPPYTDVYAKYALTQYIKGFGIDVVVTILDCWDPNSYDIPDIVHKFRIPLVSHVTTRSYPLSPHWSTFLDRADHIVAPTQWGRAMIEEIFPNRSSYIQHGVDLNVFKPDGTARNELRKLLGYEDKFVFLAVGRNKEMQKRYDFLLKSFKALLTNMPGLKGKVILHIHTNPHEAYDLEVMRKMGYHYIGEENVVFSSVKPDNDRIVICRKDDPKSMTLNPNWGLDEKEMSRLYNMADCFVHSGEGESFCLPCMEAQACGLPSVVPDNSVFPEIVGKPESGILCRTITEETTPTLTDVKLVNMLDLAQGLYKIYADEETRKKCSQNALKNAQNYGWKEVIDKWLFILKKITEPRPLNYQNGEMGF